MIETLLSSVVVAAGLALASPVLGAESVLWYRQPAAKWVEALPVGNGRLGAMVFGGAPKERSQPNEETLWDGYPIDTTDPEVRQALDRLAPGRVPKENRARLRPAPRAPPRGGGWQDPVRALAGWGAKAVLAGSVTPHYGVVSNPGIG